ncbi:glycosyltransferase family 4 protein [Pontibacter pamirensis]|uniref:glycosyltransferase family 4 protein n=1 Tax=Pontibacter pamirensis TaxID=2562824 RepID=UPI00138A417A|nr:glycosyltransferase family 4 protein [Pontibacter pamirensis]
MEQNKLKVYHFHNGSGGGVLSVIINIIKYSVNPLIEHHIIHVINKNKLSEFRLLDIDGAKSENVFFYNPKSNFYHICKRLSRLLPDANAVVVAHDWFELGMATNLGLQNPVVQFLHGDYDYYYKLAKKHVSSIDRYITVSKVIYSNLCSILPHEAPRISRCRFPVPPVKSLERNNQFLKAFFCVRRLDDTNKQFDILPLINTKLKEKGITVEWTIIGEGLKNKEQEKVWGNNPIVTHHSSLSNEAVVKLLPENDIFLLPSIKEGFPVSLVEAMKAGLVPLVTNWAGATDELITPGETGYYVEVGDIDAYVHYITMLNNDRALLKKLSQKGEKRARTLFDPFLNVKKIEEIFFEAFDTKKKDKLASKTYGSRLDQHLIPDFVTSTFRSLLARLN